ncbi:MAG: hypothetical protein ACREQN_12700 [Candidatus Binataceae bacterium]
MSVYNSNAGNGAARATAAAASATAQRGRDRFCALLRTKNGYFRSPAGERLIDADSSTACYNCLMTQRPVGPDGLPATADRCRSDRVCYREDV